MCAVLRAATWRAPPGGRGPVTRWPRAELGGPHPGRRLWLRRARQPGEAKGEPWGRAGPHAAPGGGGGGQVPGAWAPAPLGAMRVASGLREAQTKTQLPLSSTWPLSSVYTLPSRKCAGRWASLAPRQTHLQDRLGRARGRPRAAVGSSSAPSMATLVPGARHLQGVRCPPGSRPGGPGVTSKSPGAGRGPSLSIPSGISWTETEVWQGQRQLAAGSGFSHWPHSGAQAQRLR